VLVSVGWIDGVGVDVGFAVTPDMRVRPGCETNRIVLASRQGKELVHHAVDFGPEGRPEYRRVSIQIRLSDRGIERQRTEERPVAEPGLYLARLIFAADA